MTKILAISGSLRVDSYNSALLRAAAALAPADVVFKIGSIRGIPLYDGDVERDEGEPEAVTALKAEIVAADGLLIASPEYNHSMPGVLKNAIDWLSRTPKGAERVFRDKPLALIGATPGMGGTRMSQTAWLPVLRSLGVRPYFDKQLYVAGAGKAFEAGQLVDETVAKLLGELVAGFAAFAATQRG